jgi:hypothetical protein
VLLVVRQEQQVVEPMEQEQIVAVVRIAVRPVLLVEVPSVQAVQPESASKQWCASV